MVEPEESPCRAWWWTAVYAANVLLPLTAGVWITTGKGGGLIGMLAAVGMVWLVGLGGCYQLPRVTEAVTVGGMYVATFQLLPVPHVAAGVVAVIAWDQVAGASPFQPPGWRAELGGFVVTLLTALPLVLIAWLLGGGPKLLFAAAVARTADEADYIEPEPGADRSEPSREQ